LTLIRQLAGGNVFPFRRCGVLGIATATLASSAAAQPSLVFTDVVKPVASMKAPLRSAIEAKAKGYRFVGFAFFGSDSALLVFEDSTLTTPALRANTWMWGPPVSVAEADGCPPEKVLGRQIARALFRALGRPTGLQQIMVAVHGTLGLDQRSAESMYYYPEQLTGRWAGDPSPR
jgi:hypothetical protein